MMPPLGRLIEPGVARQMLVLQRLPRTRDVLFIRLGVVNHLPIVCWTIQLCVMTDDAVTHIFYHLVPQDGCRALGMVVQRCPHALLVCQRVKKSLVHHIVDSTDCGGPTALALGAHLSDHCSCSEKEGGVIFKLSRGFELVSECFEQHRVRPLHTREGQRQLMAPMSRGQLADISCETAVCSVRTNTDECADSCVASLRRVLIALAPWQHEPTAEPFLKVKLRALYGCPRQRTNTVHTWRMLCCILLQGAKELSVGVTLPRFTPWWVQRQVSMQPGANERGPLHGWLKQPPTSELKTASGSAAMARIALFVGRSTCCGSHLSRRQIKAGMKQGPGEDSRLLGQEVKAIDHRILIVSAIGQWLLGDVGGELELFSLVPYHT